MIQKPSKNQQHDAKTNKKFGPQKTYQEFDLKNLKIWASKTLSKSISKYIFHSGYIFQYYLSRWQCQYVYMRDANVNL